VYNGLMGPFHKSNQLLPSRGNVWKKLLSTSISRVYGYAYAKAKYPKSEEKRKVENVTACLISFHHMDKTGDFTKVLLHQDHIAKVQSTF
jgi:hypothetical protein